PGATIRYCITVTNNGGANATNVIITDAMPNDGAGGYYVTYQPGTLYAGGADCDPSDEPTTKIGAGETAASQPNPAASATDDYGVTAANTVTTTISGSVAGGGTSVTTVFDVKTNVP